LKLLESLGHDSLEMFSLVKSLMLLQVLESREGLLGMHAVH
jgi:hypothetical protein